MKKGTKGKLSQAIITKNAKLAADNIVVGIENPVLRKRLFVYANVIESIADFMATIGLSVSTKDSLYKNIAIAKKVDIADFYIDRVRADIRVIDNVTNAVLIPKSHKELGIEPDLYIVVKVDDALKFVEIVGFLPTDQIIFDKEIQNFYILNSKKLLPIEKFKQLSYSIQPKRYSVEITQNDIFHLFVKMQEEDLPYKSLRVLLHSLLGNLYFLAKLNMLQKIDSISKNLSSMPDLLEDLSPVIIQDFADDDLGGMDNIEEVELFGDEQIIDVAQSEVDEVLDELNPDFGKEPDFEPMFKQERKPLILHVVAIILVGIILMFFGLGKKDTHQNGNQPLKKVNVINNAIIPNLSTGVKKLSWGISNKLTQDQQLVDYLNWIGQTIKMDLSDRIQLNTENPSEKTIKVAIVLDNNARFDSCTIKQSSGSKEIDKKTIDTIKDVFAKNPADNIHTSAPFIRAILIIDL
jgi:hypothetical protein